MSMNGIDVSSNQPANICTLVDYDFAIVKVSGNPQGYAWDYVNPYWRQQAADALAKCGCLGLYHFTWGKAAETEADFFLAQIGDYVGRAVLVIDYEGEAVRLGREWLRAFIRRIVERTGVNPMVYAGSADIIAQDLVQLCRDENCGLWSANYWQGYNRIDGYDSSACRMDVAGSAMWQFTSTGYLDGYGHGLDLNHFFGDADAWRAYAAGDGCVPEPKDPPAKTVEQLAEEVINGLWGNGEDRRSRLSAAGYDADAVQACVNAALGSPSPSSRVYTVVAGDTLSGIGAKLGVDWRTIASRNGIENPNVIYPGQKISY